MPNPSCCQRGHSQVFFAQTGEQTVPYISNASQGDLWINPTLKLIYAFVDCYWQQVSCCNVVRDLPRSLERSVELQEKFRAGYSQQEQTIQAAAVVEFGSAKDFVMESAGYYTIQFQANLPNQVLSLALKKNYNVELIRSRVSGSTISLLWTGQLEQGDRLIVQAVELEGQLVLSNAHLSIVQL